jgi:hypothetical protein
MTAMRGRSGSDGTASRSAPSSTRRGNRSLTGAGDGGRARAAARQASNAKLPDKAKVPAAVAGAAALALAAGVAGGVTLAPRGKLLGVRLGRRPSLGARVASAARGATGRGVEVGRVLQRLSAIESELHELRMSARPAQRRSPVEVVLGGLTRRPGEPR